MKNDKTDENLGAKSARKVRELIIDIETIPDTNLPIDLRPEPALGNLKDPVKVAAKVAEWEEGGQIKKMAISPFMNQIVSIQAWSTFEDSFVDFGATDEASGLTSLMDCIDAHDIIVGHNLIGFDLPTIRMRAMMNGVELSHKFGKIKRYSNCPFFDTMQELAGWDSSQWKGLDWWCKRLGLEGKSDHGSNVYQMHKDGRQNDIDAYCRDDVKATRGLYDRVKPYYK